MNKLFIEEYTRSRRCWTAAAAHDTSQVFLFRFSFDVETWKNSFLIWNSLFRLTFGDGVRFRKIFDQFLGHFCHLSWEIFLNNIFVKFSCEFFTQLLITRKLMQCNFLWNLLKPISTLLMYHWGHFNSKKNYKEEKLPQFSRFIADFFSHPYVWILWHPDCHRYYLNFTMEYEKGR